MQLSSYTQPGTEYRCTKKNTRRVTVKRDQHRRKAGFGVIVVMQASQVTDQSVSFVDIEVVEKGTRENEMEKNILDKFDERPMQAVVMHPETQVPEWIKEKLEIRYSDQCPKNHIIFLDEEREV